MPTAIAIIIIIIEKTFTILPAVETHSETFTNFIKDGIKKYESVPVS